MKKLQSIQWYEFIISLSAVSALAFAISFNLGVFVTGVWVLLTLSVYINREPKTVSVREMQQNLIDLDIARQIMFKAYLKGTIDRSAYLKGELQCTREINLQKMAIGSVRRGSRIEVKELQEFEKAHRYF